MEELIKYYMHVQYHKSLFLKKKLSHFSSNLKQFNCFLLIAAFKTHLYVVGKFTWIGKMT